MAMSNSELEMALPNGTRLNNRYVIKKVLGIGGFGITYLASDEKENTEVAVKEYFPFQYVSRDKGFGQVTATGKEGGEVFLHGIHVFKRECGVLQKFSGVASIVQVSECFDQNGTSYFTMEFLDGVNAKALVRSMGGRLPINLAEEILVSIANILKLVHNQGLLHRDISPENIFITKNGQIKLIDFGATRFFIGEKSRSLSVVLKPGFAPAEQYSSKGNQGPWTDIYALCATIYLLVTGNPIPDAPSRIDGETFQPLRTLFPEISPGLDQAVNTGLCMDYRKRPQNVEEFLKIMTQKLDQKPVQQLVRQPIQQQVQQPVNQLVQQSVGQSQVPFLLLIKEGVQKDQWQIPPEMVMKVGRSSEECHIVLDEPGISRVHCTLQYESQNRSFKLIDLSSNGTYLVKGKMEKGIVYRLEPGEIFHLISNQIVMKVRVE